MGAARFDRHDFRRKPIAEQRWEVQAWAKRLDKDLVLAIEALLSSEHEQSYAKQREVWQVEQETIRALSHDVDDLSEIVDRQRSQIRNLRSELGQALSYIPVDFYDLCGCGFSKSPTDSVRVTTCHKHGHLRWQVT